MTSLKVLMDNVNSSSYSSLFQIFASAEIKSFVCRQVPRFSSSEFGLILQVSGPSVTNKRS